MEQVGHMEDHSCPRAPDRFADQMPPMWQEDPLRFDSRYSFRGELGVFGSPLNLTSAKSLSQCTVLRAARKQQQVALLER